MKPETVEALVPHLVPFVSEAMSRKLLAEILAALTTTPEYQALVADARRKDCVWTSDGDDSPWDGTCGVAWMFIDGGPEENQMAYCPQCGGKLTAQTYDEVASEDAAIDAARGEG